MHWYPAELADRWTQVTTEARRHAEALGQVTTLADAKEGAATLRLLQRMAEVGGELDDDARCRGFSS